MATATNAKVIADTNDTPDIDENAVQDAISRGYTPERLVREGKNLVRAEFYGVGYVATRKAAGMSRDAVHTELTSGGLSSTNATKYIGNESQFSKYATVAELLEHCGIDIGNAAVFDDETVCAKLDLLSRTVMYEARDVIRAAPRGKKAFAAALAFHNQDGDTRKKAVSAATEKLATAAARALDALPETAPDEERAAAEKAAEKAAKDAEKARTKLSPRTSSTFTLDLGKASYTELHALCDTYNGDSKGKQRLTINEFVMAAARAFVNAATAS